MLIFTCSKNTSRKNEKYFSIPDLYSECFFMIFSSRVCFWFYFIQIELIEADGAHLLGRWCNSTLPPPITSSASEVTLRYFSILYLVGFFWFSVTHELCQYIFSLIDLAPSLCVFKHWKKQNKLCHHFQICVRQFQFGYRILGHVVGGTRGTRLWWLAHTGK